MGLHNDFISCTFDPFFWYGHCLRHVLDSLDSFSQALPLLAILLLTSALEERSEAWKLPRYLNLEICYISCSINVQWLIRALALPTCI